MEKKFLWQNCFACRRCKNVKDILIPSEERPVQMYPMDYEEFKWALGDTVTVKLLRESFEKYQPPA